MRIGNWPVLNQALEHIIVHHDEHDQMHWRSPCGSTRCLAGWIAHFGGYRDVMGKRPTIVQGGDGMSFAEKFLGAEEFLGVALPGDETDPIPIEDAALRTLDLDPDWEGGDWNSRTQIQMLARTLFSSSLTLEDILDRVLDLALDDSVTLSPIVLAEMNSVPGTRTIDIEEI